MAVNFKSEKRNFVNETDIFSSAVKNTIPTGGNKEPFSAQKETEQNAKKESSSSDFGSKDTPKTDDGFISYYGFSKKDNSPVEKLAEKSHRTDAGDGGTFTFKFDKNGKLGAKLKLAKGMDKTSAKSLTGVLGGGVTTVDKLHDKYELFKPDADKSIDEIFDTKAETFMDHAEKAALRKSKRYKEIRLASHKEIKQLKKEIRAENKAAENDILNSYFNSSDTHFVSEDSRFSDFVDESFKKTDARVESLFATEKKSDETTTSSRESVSAKFEKDPVTSANGYSESNIGGNSGEKSIFVEQNKEAATHRKMNKQDMLEQKKAEQKSVKKLECRQLKRAAAAAALTNVIRTKRNLGNEWKDVNGELLTGDLLKDGTGGLGRTVTQIISNGAKKFLVNTVEFVWKIVLKLVGTIFSFVSPVLFFALILFFVVTFVFSIIRVPFALFADDTESDSVETYELSVAGSGTFHGTAYTDEEIQNIIDQIKASNADFTDTQEYALRFALSAVGSAYDQESHWNHSDNLFDCSELAYLACLAAGVDISNSGYYSAAEECRAMDNGGYTLTGDFTLKPGDLIFYGGSDNGRYKGVYHVAIYLGNIDGADKMVEAYGADRGVITSDVRTSNVVNISRVLS